MITPRPKISDPIDAANSIADAITWLSRVAAEAGFQTVVRDLLTARDRLEAIAADKAVKRRH
jgi:hypothetical protein